MVLKLPRAPRALYLIGLAGPSKPWRWLFAFGWMIGMSALLLA